MRVCEPKNCKLACAAATVACAFAYAEIWLSTKFLFKLLPAVIPVTGDFLIKPQTSCSWGMRFACALHARGGPLRKKFWACGFDLCSPSFLNL